MRLADGLLGGKRTPGDAGSAVFAYDLAALVDARRRDAAGDRRSADLVLA